MTLSFFTDLHKVTNQSSDNRSTCKHYSITLSFLNHFQHNPKRETIVEISRIENTFGLDRFEEEVDEEEEVLWDFDEFEEFDADEEEESVEEVSTETEDWTPVPVVSLTIPIPEDDRDREINEIGIEDVWER